MSRQLGLSDPSDHHDACGLGLVARIDGRASAEIVEQGLTVLTNLNHRGTTGADGKTGDGAGILVQLPHAYFRRIAPHEIGCELPEAGAYAVGMCFSWGDKDQLRRYEQTFNDAVQAEGQRVLGWRDVPTDPLAIGRIALERAPRIRQVFVERCTPDVDSFERKLYIIRRRFHRSIDRFFGDERFYVVSLSPRTVVYKGLLQGTQVGAFYPDLREPDFTSALALVHSRFSTNTMGNWSLAHPYRYIAHNGEINTLRGNLNWMRAREAQLESELFGDDMAKLHPIIEPKVSDSAAFDNALEFLHLGGRSLPQAMMTMVPEAWENDHALDADRRAFYHYSTALMQPWDGPAAIAFTDGRVIGAALDRNGLRPARFITTKDGRIVLASEDGVLPVDASEISERMRLGPGRMAMIDLEAGRVLADQEAKAQVVALHPYRQWVYDNAVGLGDLTVRPVEKPPETLTTLERQQAFAMTSEEIRLLLAPMVLGSKEADGSMGSDTPVAVLSKRPKSLFDYFHQLFAQVTNPPIDPLRERSMMSLRMSLGREHNLLIDGPHHARRIILPSPVLTDSELARVQNLADPQFRCETISLLWKVSEGPGGLRRALDAVCDEAVAAVRRDASILVLSDRGVSNEFAAIPTLLATGAIHHHLVDAGLGGSAGIVVEAADAREVHHVATLIAFGAEAVNPYLAMEVADTLHPTGARNYRHALDKGLLKVISKMGISTLHSYCGSQLYEIVGLNEDVVQRCFRRAPSRIGGQHLEGLAREVIQRHRGRRTDDELDPGGEYQLREQGERHQWNERTIPLLQRATRNGDFATFEEFSRVANGESAERMTLRSLFEFVPDSPPISLDDVEPAREIVKRFSTGAMSMGALSKESHETLAIAMNRLGGHSNSGEGGEDPKRFTPDANGDLMRSAIKQVASGRFGVTAHYLVNADMIQIKMAQGAKPGEGGQLPGHKVSDEIAWLRNSTPGVGLISPPPHHDIYSIEDLSQLIFDLGMANPKGMVSVKLVSEAGVGTIAAGVSKAKADHITISGFDGGTGAAVQSSIKHAGLPWELGLAETQQVLVENGLRSRVRLQVDGMLRTGRDVVVGALLGADDFGFSTAPLIALGCVMMRVCHLNTCPVGVATQDPVLRQRFSGQPEHVINYFFFVAEEVRKIMASLGIAKLDDLIGHVELLRQRDALSDDKSRDIDLSGVLMRTGAVDSPLRHTERQSHAIHESFDARLLPQLDDALNGGAPVTVDMPVHNTDRTVGALISGEIARRHGRYGLPDNSITLRLHGVAGQSFGAWSAAGLTLDLEGAANDYVGKGLSGGTIILRPPPDAAYIDRPSIIAGNVLLYGATAGRAFFGGVVGERFAVRNSGATAVVEGCGAHGCEYMTGGTVVILGPVGRNFAAGMSGGIAYLYEPARDVRRRCNQEMVGLYALDDHDEELVKHLIRQHVDHTGSVLAARILHYWDGHANDFVKVWPHDLKRVMDASAEDSASDDEELQKAI